MYEKNYPHYKEFCTMWLVFTSYFLKNSILLAIFVGITTTKCGHISLIPIHWTSEFIHNPVKSLDVHG